MTNFNISGLVSGIDTTSLITQLMTVAAKPQTLLKSQLSTQASVTSAYTSINAKMAAVQKAADALKAASAWNAATVTSSDTSVAAASVTGASAGSRATFSVLRVATAQVTTVAAGGSAVADPASGIDLVDSTGTSHHIDLSAGSAAGVASAVNNAGLGVRASVITTDAGAILQFTSTSTGSTAAFTLSGLSAPGQNLTDAQDAQIAVGDVNAGGYTVSSHTNTFNGAIPGVTFTVSRPVDDVTLALTTDQDTITGNVSDLVDAVNAALKEIGTDTAQGGVLAGDSTLRGLQQQLLSTVSSGSSGASFDDYGVSLETTGQLDFDADRFAEAFGQDPVATQAALSALAGGFSAIAVQATDTTSGTLTGLIASGASKADDLTQQIAKWDTRLADQQASLQTRYTAMETAISKLKSQSSYLTSMFSSLTSSSSSSSSSS